MKKNNNLIILLMVVIILILGCLCVLFATGIVSINSFNTKNSISNKEKNNLNNNEKNNLNNKEKNSSDSEQNENIVEKNTTANNDNTKYNSVGVDNDTFSQKIGDSNLGFIKMMTIDNNGTSLFIGLTVSGKVMVDYDKEISNVSNVSDIVTFSDSDGPGVDDSTTLYILDSDGYLYSYTTKNYNAGILKADKLEKYSNVKKIFTYSTRSKNTGGCDKLIIDSNNDYIELKSFCA